MKIKIKYTNLDTRLKSEINFTDFKSVVDWDNSNNVFIVKYDIIHNDGSNSGCVENDINAGAELHTLMYTLME